jgi:5-methylcytosine-specific restriction endonuclease McrA
MGRIALEQNSDSSRGDGVHAKAIRPVHGTGPSRAKSYPSHIFEKELKSYSSQNPLPWTPDELTALQSRFDRTYADARARWGDMYPRQIWGIRRRAVLAVQPRCVLHDGIGRAEEIDHIVPRSQGGTDAWENLQPVCTSCHDRKGVREGTRR